MPEKRMAAVAVAFTIGILAADYISLVGCALICVSVVFAVMIFAPAKQRGTLALVLAVAMSGAWRYAADRSVSPDDISHFSRQVSAFEGRVASDASGAEDSLRCILRVNRARLTQGWRNVSGDLMVSFHANENTIMPRLDYGDSVRILVRPYIPSEPTNPGQFSWKGYLARRGIYACASVRGPDQMIVLHRGRACGIVCAALTAKRYLVSSIRRIHPAGEASVMCGVVLGTYSYLDDDTLRDFTRTGTLHVLAASGYNCLILVLFSSPLLRLFRVFPRYRCAVMLFLIGMYLLMVGPAPSLVRAAIMTSLVLLATPFKRIPDYANLFYVAAFIVLMFNPSNLFDIGFQLSFLAVWALIVITPVIESLMFPNPADRTGLTRRKHWSVRAVAVARVWLVRVIASTASATIAISLVTEPVIAYYFHYLSLSALPANLAVALVEPVVFFDSFISAITALVPHCAGWIGGVGTLSTRAMLCSVGYLGSLRYSAVSMQSPNILGIAGYYIILWAVAGYVRSKFASR